MNLESLHNGSEFPLMCGLAGHITHTDCQRISSKSLSKIAEDMANTLVHRGPDGSGVWSDPDVGIGLGFRRLSIQDLSPAGTQPMVSADGQWVIVFNGEIYNFQELGRELEAGGRKLRSSSDTEVVLEACATWGVVPAVKRFVGMFAIAIWSVADRKLYLIRDRLGVKPLYWGQFPGLFVFGSELKALRAHDGWTPKINPSAAQAFFRHTYVPDPFTIYNGVHKVSPGEMVVYCPSARIIRKETYWSVADAAVNGLVNPLDISDAEAIDAFEKLLFNAVERRMIADVPVGAFLSGGIDSSAVVAAMQNLSSQPVKTFTIGFSEEGFNEAIYAKEVAAHLNTDHTEKYFPASAALDLIPTLSDLYDEPFADSSQLPTTLVSRLAREKVTVALTGDGGDEMLGGYPRYFQSKHLLQRLELVPHPLRKPVSAMIQVIPEGLWDVMLKFCPEQFKPSSGGRGMHWFADMLRPSNRTEIYRGVVSNWPDPQVILPNHDEAKGKFWDLVPKSVTKDYIDHVQYLDTGTYLPDDILVKVDRASMSVGLEARGPLLDHSLHEFCWQLPRRFKTRDGKTKWVLDQVLRRYVPGKLIDRPKMGFGVPIGQWLTGPLRDWAEELIAEKALIDGGLIDPKPVRQAWRQHIEGTQDWAPQLWSVLMFQSWRQRWSV